MALSLASCKEQVLNLEVELKLLGDALHRVDCLREGIRIRLVRTETALFNALQGVARVKRLRFDGEGQFHGDEQFNRQRKRVRICEGDGVQKQLKMANGHLSRGRS